MGSDIESSVDRIARETRFSDVVRVDRGDDVLFCKPYLAVLRSEGEWQWNGLGGTAPLGEPIAV